MNLPLDSILTGDCTEILGQLPENSVDMVFADPPYNLQLRQELWRPNMTKVDAVDDQWDQFDSFEAYDRFTRAWLSACRRVLKDTGTIWVIGSYHNIYRVGAILQDLGYWILNDVVLDPFMGSGTTGVVAKLLGRRWIGIERDAEYVRIASKRLDEVQPAPSDALRVSEPRQRPRLPFGALLEAGLLRPGQALFLGPKNGKDATVLANGHVRCGETTGSIHQIARLLTGAPCNGWEAWYYEDEHTGQRAPIDQLRQHLREKIEKGV